MEQKYQYQIKYALTKDGLTEHKNLFIEVGCSNYHVIDKAYNFLIRQGHKIKRRDLIAIKL